MRTIAGNQNGVSLIITFFIMIIILAVVLSISTLLYSEVKIIRNISSSVVGFYAADSGIEKVLFYDRQVLPAIPMQPATSCTPATVATDCPTGYSCPVPANVCSKPAPRGLCSMYLSDLVKYPNACAQDMQSPYDPTVERSIYCNNTAAPQPGLSDPIYGCDPSVCDDCSINFTTAFDKDSKTYYTTNAKVYPGTLSSNIQIESKGFFSGAERQIQITTNSP